MALVLVCCLYSVLITVVAVVCITTIARQAERNVRMLAEWMELTAKSQTSAVSEVTAAVGKTLQTAMFPAPQPLPPPTLDGLRQVVQDAMIRHESPDYSDPTDGAAWLAQPRDSVAMIDPNDPEPYGIPGLRNMHLPPPEPPNRAPTVAGVV